jgi:hypothetical protein
VVDGRDYSGQSESVAGRLIRCMSGALPIYHFISSDALTEDVLRFVPRFVKYSVILGRTAWHIKFFVLRPGLESRWSTVVVVPY